MVSMATADERKEVSPLLSALAYGLRTSSCSIMLDSIRIFGPVSNMTFEAIHDLVLSNLG